MDMNMNMPKTKGSKKQQHRHNLTLNIEKGLDESIIIGQIAEIPSIIVQAVNKTELHKAAITAVKGYLKAFPDEHDKIFHGKNIQKDKIMLKISA
jgi:hypothetical protein